MKGFLKKLSLILVLALALSCFSLPAAAEETEKSFTVFEGTKKIEGWYPAFVSSYQNPGQVTMEQLKKALTNDNAVIEVTFTGNAGISLLLQSYPVSGGNHYTWYTFNDSSLYASGDKKVAAFSAAKLINGYTSTKHEDDGSYLRLDNLLNFGIGGEGNTVYSVVVKWYTDGVSKIRYNPAVTHQTITGWGASYTWYGDWLTQLNCKEQGFDWIFNDCEFNILRFRDLNKVRGYGGGFEDTSYKAYKMYYDAAVKRGIDPIVLVTSWGQYTRELDFVEFTQKDDRGFTYYTLAKDKNGNYMYDELADFCVESVRLFQKAGIPVHYFSISNETELQGTGRDENGNARNEAGFYLGANENQYHCAYWKAHIAVYNAFKEAFGDDAPSLTGAEVMADRGSLMQEYLDPLIKNGYGDTFDTITHHLYGSENSPNSFADVYNRFGDKYALWQTEWYNHNFLDHCNVMINELNYENITAYLYWNGVWPEDEANCLIETSGFYPWDTIKRRGNHYVMMHFSKYIKQGYKRIDAAPILSDVNTTAFISPDGSELVTVILNNGGSQEDIKLEVTDYDITSSKVYQSTFNSTKYVDKGKDSDGKRLYNDDVTQNVYIVDKGSLDSDGKLTVPKNTITTVVAKIELSNPDSGDATADGKVDDKDLSAVLDHITGKKPLEGKKYDAANVRQDQAIDIKDYNALFAYVYHIVSSLQ